MILKERKIITQVVSHLKKEYGDETTGHDWLHIERVWKMARKLAKGENVDMFILELAALLHDVDDHKFRKPGAGEYDNLNRILSSYTFSEAEQLKIKRIVSHISFKSASTPSVQDSIEGKIVQDADRLDALGAIGIARCFTYNGFRGNPLYKPQKNSAIAHFHDKLLVLKNRMNTPRARKIAQQRHEFLEMYLKQFWGEIDGKA